MVSKYGEDSDVCQFSGESILVWMRVEGEDVQFGTYNRDSDPSHNSCLSVHLEAIANSQLRLSFGRKYVSWDSADFVDAYEEEAVVHHFYEYYQSHTIE